MVSWTPPTDTTDIDVTGYRIFYDDGTGEQFMDITGSGMTTATISGLTTGSTYSITIVATSDGLPSEVVGLMMVGLGMRCVFITGNFCLFYYVTLTSSRLLLMFMFSHSLTG